MIGKKLQELLISIMKRLDQQEYALFYNLYARKLLMYDCIHRDKCVV